MNDARLIDSSAVAPPAASPVSPPVSWHGFRLAKLELFNWGTFDSSRGHVHTVRPDGATTLLIGQNGSGKSTLVDAILTLLVRPVVRNYNVAAGAQKQERDERSYVKGACGRLGRDDDNRAEVQYLRGDGSHYSALLACFRNEAGAAFTVAQVLYLDGEGQPQKVYCFSEEERSIAEHCANLPDTGKLRQQMERRGFRATTSYTEYHKWFARVTGVRAKAMDMFNQTVAVKDIQSLNRFIREHMLEAKPWGERIDALQSHFTQLSEAHRSLVRVRQQFELLLPVEAKGKTYRAKAEEYAAAERVLAAADTFFRAKTVELFEPECARLRGELEENAARRCAIDSELHDLAESIRTTRNEIEQSGGQRLREIPHLLRRARDAAEAARAARLRFDRALQAAGITDAVPDVAALAALRRRLPEAAARIAGDLRALDDERNRAVVDREAVRRQEDEDQRELAALVDRQGNLPAALAEARRRLCESVRVSERELPFVAELVAVRPDQRDWQPSIEMVLRGFALSLLVPARYYATVSRYVDRTRIEDRHGVGQRLTYHRVGEVNVPRNLPPLHPQSLVRKLDLRDGHPLVAWVRAELEARHDYQCCETVDEFQAARAFAVTRQRHVKRNEVRHDKDDRDQAVDPRRFVLGWDNREKRRLLAEGLVRVRGQARTLDERVRGLAASMETLRHQNAALAQLVAVADFATIDAGAYERQAEALEREKAALEAGNHALGLLKQRLVEDEASVARLQAERDACVVRQDRLSTFVLEGERALFNARHVLDERRTSGEFEAHAESFAGIAAVVADRPLSAGTLVEEEQRFGRQQRGLVDRLRCELEPERQALCDAMHHYLNKFPEDGADLAARGEYLDSFCALCDHVRRDDLPRYEARFKERLNEKVTQEIGLLHGALQTERGEIESKVELLNRSLRQLEYRPGTYIRLEPRAVRDREIVDFQAGLRECLSGSFEGTPEADEARFVKIEKFLARLRDEQRWREKVTDVRRWFDFAAREMEEGTDVERVYYEDSAGLSGGEKAKLAFTILVAAIAYKYDIDPDRPSSERFGFVVVDEMFSKVDDLYAQYALELFAKFGLQLLIVAPLDAKARVTEPYVGCYLHVVKDPQANISEIFSMTAREFQEAIAVAAEEERGAFA